MKHQTKTFLTLAILTCILFAALAISARAPAEIDAASITSSQTITVDDGATAYTTTATSDPIFSEYYGDLTIYVSNDISGTSTTTDTYAITITVQAAIQPVACANVTEWTTSTIASVYETSSTASLQNAPAQDVIEEDDAVIFTVPAQGRCTRLRYDLATSTTYTPTAYIRLVNSQ
ncbi:MAG: hypothetical protein GVY30_00175 [Chloroflexi bacterium]|jgi:hypothetical protein|nr:hypothetical protein [Chloroflexota bacterium]